MKEFFKSEREIYEHLVAGGRVTHTEWWPENYLVLSPEGRLVDETGSGGWLGVAFDYPHSWIAWEAPEEKN